MCIRDRQTHGAPTGKQAPTATLRWLLKAFLFAWDSSSLFLRGFRGFLFFGAGGAQLIPHSIVSFMARVFKVLVSRFLLDREREREGCREGLRVFDSHRI